MCFGVVAAVQLLVSVAWLGVNYSVSFWLAGTGSLRF